MSGTNTDSVIWVAGEAAGHDGNGATAALPTPFFISTATSAPTSFGEGEGHNIFVASNDDVYLWDGTAWLGPYTT
jgi:hypothetical protein